MRRIPRSDSLPTAGSSARDSVRDVVGREDQGPTLAKSEKAANAPDAKRPGLVPVVGSITAVNLVANGLALVSGPLLARALGPAGRGDLAAILVPAALLPTLADLGLSTYVVRQVSKGIPPSTVLGAIAPVAV